MSTRPADVLRPIIITPDFVSSPVASCLIEVGRTRVLCTASVEDKVPGFRLASGGGWLTAEYSMLPGSSPYRVRRGVSKGKLDGRSTEIQRLIGRSLRAAFDLDAMGPVSLWIDCDVLEADGGTRTASITGGYVAARIAIERLARQGKANLACLKPAIAAVSVGIVEGVPTLDLDYPLDSAAEVDMNVVMDDEGGFVEIQGTAEGATFGRDALGHLLDLAAAGIKGLREAQDVAIAQALKA
jgi:ribonuclease PH